MSPVGRLPFLAVVMVTSACAGADPSAGRFSSVDSAGVTVSTSTSSAWQNAPAKRWLIDDKPVLDLGAQGNGSVYEFYRVTDATVLRDGRIAVANAGTSEIRIFSDAGSTLEVVGREGEGPGEYEQISRLLKLGGDSLGVFSWPMQLTVLAPDLTVVRTERLGVRAHAPRVLESGGLVDLEVYPAVIEYSGPTQLIRAPVSIVLRRPDGEIADTMWRGRGFEEYMFPSGNGYSAMRPLYQKGVTFAVRGASVLVGTTESMEYQVLDLNGTVQQIVRVADYDVSLASAEIDAERAAYLGPDPSPSLKDMVGRLPQPETRPAYADFLVDFEHGRGARPASPADTSLSRIVAAPRARAVLVALTAWAFAGCDHDAGAPQSLWRDPATGMEFVLVRPGAFDMGLLRPPGDLREAPSHRVRLTQPFFLGRYEVTQAQWRQVMDTVPSQFADCGDTCPVETVSWLDVWRFIARLNERDSPEYFRLPTEAEWEYACRAGSETRYGGAIDTLQPGLANYDSRIPFDGIADDVFVGRPRPVGSYPANPWGLFDLAGSVWEWTEDDYCPYAHGPTVDPRGACGSDTIAIRGGSWAFSANAARCGRRYTHHRADSGYSLGFRLVREVPETERQGRRN